MIFPVALTVLFAQAIFGDLLDSYCHCHPYSLHNKLRSIRSPNYSELISALGSNPVPTTTTTTHLTGTPLVGSSLPAFFQDSPLARLPCVRKRLEAAAALSSPPVVFPLSHPSPQAVAVSPAVHLPAPGHLHPCLSAAADLPCVRRLLQREQAAAAIASSNSDLSSWANRINCPGKYPHTNLLPPPYIASY